MAGPNRVRVPDTADEAVRDLVRAREDAVREQRNARHRLKALLLRNGIASSSRAATRQSTSARAAPSGPSKPVRHSVVGHGISAEHV